MRRTIFWLGGILLVVLQIDFWIAPWHSRLAAASLLGSTILGLVCFADGLFQLRGTIWRWIMRLKRE